MCFVCFQNRILNHDLFRNKWTILKPFLNKNYELEVDCLKVIQQIDDEFLKWFLKNPNCEFVEVKIERTFDCSPFKKYPGACGLEQECTCEYYNKYKIIIPEEKPKKYVSKLRSLK